MKNIELKLELEKALNEDKNNAQKTLDESNLEEQYAEASAEKFENQKREIEINELTHELHTRKFLTNDLFVIVKNWFIFIGLVIILTGFSPDVTRVFPFIIIHSFRLSDNVLMSLLGSTTITIVGLYSPVIAHFFNHKKKL